jgi:hypothetical protein
VCCELAGWTDRWLDGRSGSGWVVGCLRLSRSGIPGLRGARCFPRRDVSRPAWGPGVSACLPARPTVSVGSRERDAFLCGCCAVEFSEADAPEAEALLEALSADGAALRERRRGLLDVVAARLGCSAALPGGGGDQLALRAALEKPFPAAPLSSFSSRMSVRLISNFLRRAARGPLGVPGAPLGVWSIFRLQRSPGGRAGARASWHRVCLTLGLSVCQRRPCCQRALATGQYAGAAARLRPLDSARLSRWRCLGAPLVISNRCHQLRAPCVLGQHPNTSGLHRTQLAPLGM